MTETEESRPWRWPGEWVRQEAFWRDVGSRTLSAVLAAGILYAFAVAGGYVSRPEAVPFMVAVVWFPISIWWHNKTSKLNKKGWYGRKPLWLLRIGEWGVVLADAVVIYYIFFI